MNENLFLSFFFIFTPYFHYPHTYVDAFTHLKMDRSKF